MKQLIYIASVLSGACWCASALAVPSGLGPLTFEDQFEGTQLDLTTWNYRAAGSLRNDAIVDPQAIEVDNGVLKVKVFTTEVAGIKQHHAGMIATSQLTDGSPQGFEQTYGYFESRVRFHDTIGAWSAFWLQSRTIGNGDPRVQGVEMDIFEHRIENPFDSPPIGNEPRDVDKKIHSALIWGGYPPDDLRTNHTPDIPSLINNDPVLDRWHTVGLLWEPAGYTFYFDDEVIWTQNAAQAPVSMRSQYIILSTEVWDDFAGAIPVAGYGTLANTTTFTEYDYIRVYAIPEPAAMGVLAVLGSLALSRRCRVTPRGLAVA